MQPESWKRSTVRGSPGPFLSATAFAIALMVSAQAHADTREIDRDIAAAREASSRGEMTAAADLLMAAWKASEADGTVTADERVRLADALVSRLMDVQRFAEAEAIGRAGLALIPEVKNPRIAAEGASVFPIPLTRLGKSAEAEQLFRSAKVWRLKVPGDTRALQLANAQRLAVALALQGKLVDATDVLAPLAPVALAADYPDPVRGLVIPQTLAGLQMLQGKPEAALPVLEAMKPRALALWTSPRQKAEFLETLGEAYRMTKRNAQARDAYLEGLAVLSAGQPGTTGTEATLHANLARVLLALGDPAEAAIQSDAALTLMRARAEKGRASDGTLSAQDAQLLRGVVALDLDARFANRDHANPTSRASTDAQAFARIEEALALAQPVSAARLGAPGSVAIADMMALLRPDESFLMILPGTDAVHVMGVTKEGLAWNRLDKPIYGFCPSLAALRAGIVPGQPLRCTETRGDAVAGAFDPVQAHALWQELFVPLGAGVLAKPRWIVSTAGVASALPLGVLVMAPPGSADFAGLAWLGRKKALSYLPLPADLVRLRGEGPVAGQARLVGFGAPCTGAMAGEACRQMAADAGGGMAALAADFSLMRSGPDGRVATDPGAVATLPALPAAARELAALADLTPGRASIATGRAATETAVRAADVPQGAILAFATHGLAAGAFGLPEPSLVLTPPATPSATDDGLLTASEVSGLSFPDAFVILSACNTAGVRSIEALDPYAGFARAFFKAGARALLLSQFEVPDEGAARLTTATVANLSRNPGAGRAEALRRAIDGLLNDPSAAAFHHPRVWGAMVLVGAPD